MDSLNLASFAYLSNPSEYLRRTDLGIRKLSDDGFRIMPSISSLKTKLTSVARLIIWAYLYLVVSTSLILSFEENIVAYLPPILSRYMLAIGPVQRLCPSNQNRIP